MLEGKTCSLRRAFTNSLPGQADELRVPIPTAHRAGREMPPDPATPEKGSE